ncbi:neuropeptide FF receptor 2-like [Lineus longissimus]|uniref:neuropeptide FF receptor 2-like n=1 Tax=Lineus longissimus TaxID=88925 RepID=UPI002B4C571B
MEYYSMSTTTSNMSIDEIFIPSPTVAILIGIDVCFIILCIVGNLSVLITTAKAKTLRTPSFLFVLSVVLGHLLVGFFILPMFIISHFPEKYMTTPICKVIMYLSKIASNASILSLIPLTVDSFLKNSRFNRKKNLTYSNALIQLAIVWTISIAYALFFPLVYEMVEKVFPKANNPSQFWSTNMCDFPTRQSKAHKMFLIIDMLIMYIIPVIILASMYIHIFWWQWKGLAKKKVHEINAKGRAAVTKAGVLFLTAFVFCSLGNYGIMMYTNWGPGHFVNIHLWQSVSALFAYTQSWLNVVLLILFNKPFRDALLHRKVNSTQEQISEMKELKNGTSGSLENIAEIQTNMGKNQENIAEIQKNMDKNQENIARIETQV